MPSPLTSEQERLTTIFFYCIVVLLGYLFFRILAPFFAPLGWAAVLAIFVYPCHERLVSRHGNAGAAGLSLNFFSMSFSSCASTSSAVPGAPHFS